MKVWGAKQVLHERARQLKQEGFRWAHDDAHTSCELIQAAQTYAEAARRQALGGDAEEVAGVAAYWPWDLASLKIADDPTRNLAKAGALLAAEIDRLQRVAAKKGEL